MKLRTPRLATLALSLAFATAPAFVALPAFAVNKDMVQLQTQIQELQDAIARLQQSNDERMGVMKDLVQQTADSMNKMSVTVDTLQKQMAAQQDNPKLDQVSGQIQSLNDSIDELKARLAHIDRSISLIQDQQQSMNANMQSGGGAPAGGSRNVPPPAPAAAQDLPATAPTTDAPPADMAPAVRTKPSAASGASPAPPAEDLYKTALGDYMGARYALATAEFGDVVKYYPDNALAGNSFYYLGEIDYRAGKYASADKDYDKLLGQYPASNKVPAAHLHKGEALIAMKQNEVGISELRTLIQRFPNSPEAMQARSKLSGMGVAVKPKTAGAR